MAEQAFKAAKARFEADLNKDPRKLGSIHAASSLEDVYTVVFAALERYESRRKETATRDCLVRLSQRVHLYSGILDIFAQHHPEYVALAWGSMKFLIIVCYLVFIPPFSDRIFRLQHRFPDQVRLKRHLSMPKRSIEALGSEYSLLI